VQKENYYETLTIKTIKMKRHKIKGKGDETDENEEKKIL